MVKYNFRFLTYLTILILLILRIPTYGYPIAPFQDHKQNILGKVSSELLDPEGREFSIWWQYSFEEDTWSGTGLLQILGRDILKLTLPDQEILIRESVVKTWYRETDQVIIDHFDRSNPSNVFCFLQGNYNGYSVVETENLPDSLMKIKLMSETLVGFEELDMLIYQKTWLPVSISAKAGDDMVVTIKILEADKLQNINELRNATLNGSEIIDLRE